VKYATTLAASTLMILLLKKKSNKKISERKYEKFKKILFIKMKISQLISYLRNMCGSCQGTMVAI
jgi:hypothetical protein